VETDYRDPQLIASALRLFDIGVLDWVPTALIDSSLGRNIREKNFGSIDEIEAYIKKERQIEIRRKHAGLQVAGIDKAGMKRSTSYACSGKDVEEDRMIEKIVAALKSLKVQQPKQAQVAFNDFREFNVTTDHIRNGDKGLAKDLIDGISYINAMKTKYLIEDEDNIIRELGMYDPTKGLAPLYKALFDACGVIQRAEKEHNWRVGEPQINKLVLPNNRFMNPKNDDGEEKANLSRKNVYTVKDVGFYRELEDPGRPHDRTNGRDQRGRTPDRETGNSYYNRGRSGDRSYNRETGNSHYYNRGRSGDRDYNRGRSGDRDYNRGRYDDRDYNRGRSGERRYDDRDYNRGRSGERRYDDRDYNRGRSSERSYNRGRSGERRSDDRGLGREVERFEQLREDLMKFNQRYEGLSPLEMEEKYKNNPSYNNNAGNQNNQWNGRGGGWNNQSYGRGGNGNNRGRGKTWYRGNNRNYNNQNSNNGNYNNQNGGNYQQKAIQNENQNSLPRFQDPVPKNDQRGSY
jgi:hypothetical protein